jgi:hypothetical protein
MKLFITFTEIYKKNAMLPKTIIIFLIFTFLFSCTNDGQDNEMIEENANELDSLEWNNDYSDTIEESSVSGNVYDDPEVQEVHKEIEKKYGVQWDFCTCIVKNDSVNKALQSDKLTDDEFDLLFERSEHIDQKCKGLLVQPNATPEERAMHEKKVKKCLKEHGL